MGIVIIAVVSRQLYISMVGLVVVCVHKSWCRVSVVASGGSQITITRSRLIITTRSLGISLQYRLYLFNLNMMDLVCSVTILLMIAHLSY